MLLTRLPGPAWSRLVTLPRNLVRQPRLDVVPKRWSGHNAMEITPSNFDVMYGKNALHFWTIIGAVPLAIITFIINTRANPELSEIPEGYEPRHWEYYKHPVARFLAKHFYTPVELDHEVQMSYHEQLAESLILLDVHRQIQKTMRFYNDHRSGSFLPFYAETVRIGRDTVANKFPFHLSKEGHVIDDAYNPKKNLVAPTEGMHVPIDK